MWGMIVQLIVGIFAAIFGTLMKHPVEKKEDWKDVGRKHPENPDDNFTDADW